MKIQTFEFPTATEAATFAASHTSDAWTVTATDARVTTSSTPVLAQALRDAAEGAGAKFVRAPKAPKAPAPAPLLPPSGIDLIEIKVGTYRATIVVQGGMDMARAATVVRGWKGGLFRGAKLATRDAATRDWRPITLAKVAVMFGVDAPATEAAAPARAAQAEKDAAFEALKSVAEQGVKVVSAPQLFPTPPALALRMAEAAQLLALNPDGSPLRVLEPSAGTGNLLRAIVDVEASPLKAGPAVEVVAVEVNQALAFAIPKHLASHVAAVDFLSLPVNDETLGEFDRIIMNPPFAKGADVDHIRHAWQFLKPGGRMVALCADGPRQRETLKPWAEEMGGTYESLGPDLFKAQGTSVNVALIVVDAPAEEGAAATA